MLTKGGVDDAGVVQVTFVHPVDGSATRVALVGDFNGWSRDADPMTVADGEAHRTVALRAGERYRFRYVLDEDRWENDWRADAYEPNEHGGDDSVVDLTDVVPRAGEARAPRRRTAGRAARGGPAATPDEGAPSATRRR